MSMWQFGDEYRGLLIVEAATPHDAIALRTSWIASQREKDRAYSAWWSKVQAPKAGLWDRHRGLGPDGQKRAEERFGPLPDAGMSHIKLDENEEPTLIGNTFAYMWIE